MNKNEKSKKEIKNVYTQVEKKNPRNKKTKTNNQI